MNLLKEIKNLVYEMAVNRKTVENQITGLGNPIYIHLIKILKWEDDANLNKHLNDINEWLFQCQQKKINKKRIAAKYYKDWIFQDNIDSFKEFENIIKTSLKKYSKTLKEIRSNKEVWDIIQSIIDQISKDLENFEFDDIQNYLKISYEK